MINLIVNRDCRHFRGDLPCKPHKNHGVKCEDCQYYDKTDGIVLIVKLGALGDVIRTTPLIEKIRCEMPSKKLWWLTYSPDILPDNKIDKIFKYSPDSLTILENTDFDLVINLDKDLPACAITKKVVAKEKWGFTLINGLAAPINDLAIHKYHTGLFDDVNKENKKSYLEEIFEICGWQFEGQEYVLNSSNEYKWDIANYGKKIIGLNTGCGDRWVSRLWADEKWIALIKLLQANNYYPMLLGGSAEHEKNVYFAEKTGAYYAGHFSLKQFISLVDQCEVVVTAVTMSMHIAMGLHKKLVLMNNIFNPNEFELYNRGVLIEPEKECHCFFSGTCKNQDYFCMNHLSENTIYGAVEELCR